MIEEEIEKLKRKMDKQIKDNRPYEEIYKTSVSIDELLVKYYQQNVKVNRVVEPKK